MLPDESNDIDDRYDTERDDSLQFAQTVSAQQELKDRFTKYIYDNYRIGNGDMLLQKTEDTNVQLAFLHDNDLPFDTEI